MMFIKSPETTISIMNPEKSFNRKEQSPWHYKPWWCQPWSILLTGFGTIIGSWLLFHRYWLTAMVAIPMATWMGFFLLVWPQLMRESGLLPSHSDEND